MRGLGQGGALSYSLSNFHPTSATKGNPGPLCWCSSGHQGRKGSCTPGTYIPVGETGPKGHKDINKVISIQVRAPKKKKKANYWGWGGAGLNCHCNWGGIVGPPRGGVTSMSFHTSTHSLREQLYPQH